VTHRQPFSRGWRGGSFAGEAKQQGRQINEAKSPPSSIEVYINEQRADLKVLRMTVQMLVTRLLSNTEPDAAASTVDEMEVQMLRALTTTPATDPRIQRMRQLTTMRAEDFFKGFEGEWVCRHEPSGTPTFPQRSPAGLLTAAACGGLRSAPDWTLKDPPLVQLRIAAWTGDPRDTRP
jgi:hypothetical protein